MERDNKDFEFDFDAELIDLGVVSELTEGTIQLPPNETVFPNRS